MTAKEYLGQIRLFDVKIKELREEYQALLSLPSCDYSTERVQTSLKGDKIGNIVCKREAIAQEIDRLVGLRLNVIDFLENVNTVFEYQILNKKYVHHKNLETIAKEIGYSSDYVRKTHAQALRELNKFVPDAA